MHYDVGLGHISIDTTIAYEGNTSVKITPDVESITWQYMAKTFEHEIAGRKFTVSSFVKTAELAGGVHLQIYWLDKDGYWIWSNNEASQVVADTNDWQQIRASAVAPFGAEAVAAMIIAAPGPGNYWLDNFAVWEIPSVSVPLPNPSFEHGLEGVYAYTHEGEAVLDASTANTGATSLKVVPSSSHDTWQYEIHPFYESIAGRKFELSAYLKTELLTGHVLLLSYWRNSTGDWIWSNIEASSALTGTVDWTRLRVTVTAPFDASAVALMIVSSPGSGFYWLDSLAIEELPSTPLDLANPSFENGLDATDYYVGNGTISIDMDHANTGTNSLKVVSSASNEAWQYQTYSFGQSITNRTFTVSGYIQSMNLQGNVRVYAYWKNDEGHGIWDNISSSVPLTGTSDWTKLSATAIAPVGAVAVSIMVVCEAGGGTYWVDSLEVIEQL